MACAFTSMWQLGLEDKGVFPKCPTSIRVAPPHRIVPAPHRLRCNDMEQDVNALLGAQRRFKMEIETQWEKLQVAMVPLEQRLKGLQHRQQEESTRTTSSFRANISPMPDTAHAKDSRDAGGKSTASEEVVNEYFNEHVELACNGAPAVAKEVLHHEHDAASETSCNRVGDVEALATGPEVPTALHHLVTKSKCLVTEVEQEFAAFEQAENEEKEQDAALEGGERWWIRWLKSAKFDMLVGLTILANLVLIMIRIQYEGQIHKPGFEKPGSSAMDTFLTVLEHFFTLFFLVELILRLLANGVGYLRSISNVIDGLIVFGSCFDSWILPLVLKSSANTNLSMLRVFRLVRLMKVLRVLRVMKAFTQLRVLVQAICSSIGALVWSMTLLFVLEIIGAILLAQSLQSIIKDESKDLELREKIWNSFGTMVRSWLTIFEITMAPGSFLQHRYLFDEVHPGYTFLLITYVCLVTFAVIRVITALFLKATLSASDKEARIDEDRMRERRQGYAKRLCDSLEELRGGGVKKGHIDVKGLVKLLTYKRLTDWLDDAGLTVADAARLFKALDTGDGLVSLEEFLDAVGQICDSAGAKDFILHQETETILEIARKLHWKLAARNQEMEQ